MLNTTMPLIHPVLAVRALTFFVPMHACDGEVARHVPAECPPQGAPKGRIEQGFLDGNEKRGLRIGAGPRGVFVIRPTKGDLSPVRPLHLVSPGYRGLPGLLARHRVLTVIYLSAPPASSPRSAWYEQPTIMR